MLKRQLRSTKEYGEPLFSYVEGCPSNIYKQKPSLADLMLTTVTDYRPGWGVKLTLLFYLPAHRASSMSFPESGVD